MARVPKLVRNKLLPTLKPWDKYSILVHLKSYSALASLLTADLKSGEDKAYEFFALAEQENEPWLEKISAAELEALNTAFATYAYSSSADGTGSTSRKKKTRKTRLRM